MDVEGFLKNTAIRFEEADKCRTYLIVPKDNSVEENGDIKILGYFSTSTKSIKIPNALSKTKIRLLDGLNKNAEELKCYLIGQLAKNDTYKHLIDGKEILDSALNIIQKCYELMGMRVVLVECVNDKNLTDFYENNNFQLIGYDEKTELLQFVTTLTYPKPDVNGILGLQEEMTS